MEKVLLVGVGRMGLEYARVLKSTGKEIIAAGRGQGSADNFRQNTGIEVITGGIANYDFPESEMPDYAIIAVNVVDLYETCLVLLKRGIKKILIEKPAALFPGQINGLSEMSSSIGSEIYVAYNRRFCESVLEAGRIIESDGGLLSMNFEFTEWSDKVEVFDTDQLEKERWFLSNSSHVADLAFF
jgi:predicted dehydrogenase